MNKKLTILIPGSGPIIIGQAAEFDYAGTQAVKALRQLGHRVVLVNSNPTRGTTGAVIGYPEGGREQVVPAAVSGWPRFGPLATMNSAPDVVSDRSANR